MRIDTVENKVYSIADLKLEENKDLLETILDKNRDINVEYGDWWTPIYEGFKEDMKKHGVRVSQIYFSGFSSQGDGAIFEVESLDVVEFLQDNKLLTKFKDFVYEMRKDIAQNYYGHPIKKICTNQMLGHRYAKIRHSGHYYHERSYTLDFDYGYDSQDDFENYLRDFIETNAKELYKSLEKYYDELQSNESVMETLEANEYEFDVDGDIY